MATGCLGIIVGGGPAPGINGVIGAAAINAVNHGFCVRGYYDGFKWLSSDAFNPDLHSVELQIGDVARIHFDGGSILRTSRTSLLDAAQLKTSKRAKPDTEKVRCAVACLQRMGTTHVMTIGGDDTALSARFLSEASEGRLRIVHVPKTIDNDLPLSADQPTFGFHTARHYGAELVANLMEDSRSSGRWYIVETMGRSAGFLAFGMAKSAGATLSVIPEELPARTTVCNVVDIIEGAILKRRAMGRPDGVAVVAEGVSYRFGDVEELERLTGRKIGVDAAGHPRLSELPLAQIFKMELEKRFADRGDSITVVPVTLGYELRCARPIPFDMAYCRDLGHGAVTLLVSPDTPSHGVMVTMRGGDLHPVPFEALIDPETNRTRVRRVDLNATYYLVARSYMIRLEKEDFDSAEALATIAAEARMSPEEFTARYRHVVDESAVTLPPSLARSQVARVVDDPIESHRGKTSHVISL